MEFWAMGVFAESVVYKNQINPQVGKLPFYVLVIRTDSYVTKFSHNEEFSLKIKILPEIPSEIN